MSQSSVVSALQSSKSWDLTPYELQRTPQEVITDNTEIAVSPRSLHNELMCPICLDMLRSTMTTKECLHRFCAECITTALRSGNKECPTCRKKLVSRRSLRPDPNFDALISKIYPSRDEYEKHQERMLQSLTKHHNGGALSASVEEGLKSQAMSRLQKIRKHDNMMAAKACENAAALLKRSAAKHGHSDAVSPPASKRIHLDKPIQAKQESQTDPQPSTSSSKESKAEQKQEPQSVDSDGSIDMSSVEMIFKPHPDQKGPEPNKMVRYIKTSIKATVKHLAEFIKVRISLETRQGEKHALDNPTKSDKQFDMFVQQDGSFKALEAEMELEALQESYFKENNHLEIFYLEKERTIHS